MANDIDMVSDLNGTGETTVNVHEADVSSNGRDAVDVNNQAPAREPVAQPRKVDDTPRADADKPLSVRDQISAAMKTDGEPTPDTAQLDGGERPRNPDGTFAEKAPVVDPAVVDPNAAPSVAAPQGIDPQVFASLPAETQAQLARTMEDVTNNQKRFAQLEPIEQLIAPRVQAWALNGMQPAQAVHQLLALSDFAGRDAPGFIKYFAQNNGVDLEELVLGSMDDDEPVDPRIASLEQQLAQVQGTIQSQTQQQAQQAHERTVDEVIAFADEKDQSGNVLRPYLSELGDTWLPYVNMVKAQNPNWSNAQILQQAYENACWNNPGVRGKMQGAAQAAAEADRLRKEAEKVASARSASVTVRTGSPASPPAAPDSANRTVRDTIRAAMAQHPQ